MAALQGYELVRVTAAGEVLRQTEAAALKQARAAVLGPRGSNAWAGAVITVQPEQAS